MKDVDRYIVTAIDKDANIRVAYLDCIQLHSFVNDPTSIPPNIFNSALQPIVMYVFQKQMDDFKSSGSPIVRPCKDFGLDPKQMVSKGLVSKHSVGPAQCGGLEMKNNLELEVSLDDAKSQDARPNIQRRSLRRSTEIQRAQQNLVITCKVGHPMKRQQNPTGHEKYQKGKFNCESCKCSISSKASHYICDVCLKTALPQSVCDPCAPSWRPDIVAAPPKHEIDQTEANEIVPKKQKTEVNEIAPKKKKTEKQEKPKKRKLAENIPFFMASLVELSDGSHSEGPPVPKINSNSSSSSQRNINQSSSRRPRMAAMHMSHDKPKRWVSDQEDMEPQDNDPAYVPSEEYSSSSVAPRITKKFSPVSGRMKKMENDLREEKKKRRKLEVRVKEMEETLKSIVKNKTKTEKHSNQAKSPKKPKPDIAKRSVKKQKVSKMNTHTYVLFPSKSSSLMGSRLSSRCEACFEEDAKKNLRKSRYPLGNALCVTLNCATHPTDGTKDDGLCKRHLLSQHNGLCKRTTLDKLEDVQSAVLASLVSEEKWVYVTELGKFPGKSSMNPVNVRVPADNTASNPSLSYYFYISPRLQSSHLTASHLSEFMIAHSIGNVVLEGSVANEPAATDFPRGPYFLLMASHERFSEVNVARWANLL